ncbi:TolC family protein [Adhaeribacter sp. BT258]|uniref:TolC family protein n=1 Tax=Adhaeribacter terrigena TaxID=2793070 RepID=A0ABS1BXM6_9BACT|nr:TolC family protein [Adhaeribacter terrigena]MBK0401844.1 TolC family protein [Adhaeribacter terrigena]
MNYWKGIFLGIVISIPGLGFAQSNLDAVLNSIAQNNKAIAANKQYWEARKLAFRTGLTPENPEMVYDYMRGRPASAGNQEDFAVTQTFDFPTAYAKKKALSKEQIAQTEFQAAAFRQDILLEAKLSYLEMVYLNKQKAILARRLKTSESLHNDFQKKFKQGFANILEVNKAKIQLANLQNELRRNESQLKLNSEKLTQLNGGSAIVVSDTLYPTLAQIPVYEKMDSLVEVNDPILKTVKQQKEISIKEKEVTKALTLPKPGIGYHSQAILGQKFNGARIGVTIPLWQDKNKVKQKEAEILYSELQIHNHRTEHLHEIKALYDQYESLRLGLTDYQSLMQAVHSDVLLAKALRLGEISTTEYFMELTYFYNSYDNYLALEKEYNQVIAELYKFAL